MKIKRSKLFVFILCLVAICCLLGTVSAADVNDTTAVADDGAVSAVDQVSDAQTDELSTSNIDDWSSLNSTIQSTNGSTVQLKENTEYVGTYNININKNLTIVGADNSYITGNFSGNIFTSTGNNNVKFINVTFKNINCNMGLQLGDSVDTIENCNFINITTGSGHTSVLYNNNNFMNVVGSNFTNCTTTYGVITNYNFLGIKPNLNVFDCVFENNYASTEPGAINNCGILNVSDSTFIKNRANWWAGAIHTHSKAHTIIKNSNFVDNVAGWNGGALYTYSTLEVYNSTFIDNNCTTDNGGGAIGASNYYASTYNLTVVNSTFINNSNNRYTADNISTANGCGGAISTASGGYFDVHESTFVHNSAKTGQAIYASNVGYDGNGAPYLKIYNNTFINHTGNSNDTVYIPSGNYTFENNIFINSPQTVSSSSAKKYLLNLKPSIMLEDDENFNVNVTVNVTEGQVLVVGQDVTFTIVVNGLTEDMISKIPAVRIELLCNNDVYGFNNDYGIIFFFNESTISNPVINYTIELNKTGVYNINTMYYGYGDGSMGPCYITSNANNWNAVKNHGVFNVDYNDTTNEIVFNLTDALGNPLPLTDFKYTIDSVEATATTDENGIAKIDRVIDGKLTISCSYAGDNTYDGANSTVQIVNHKVPVKVASQIVSSDFNQTAVDYYKGERGGYFVVALKDSEGNALAGKHISIGFNGKVYNRTTDENGSARLQINLANAGVYTFATAFLGDDECNGSFVVNKITVTKKPTTITVLGTNPVKVKAYRTLTFNLKGVKATSKSSYVNAAGRTLKVTVNGKTYTLKTDKNGKATLKVRFTRAGTYTIKTAFAGDGTFNAKTMNSKITVRK